MALGIPQSPDGFSATSVPVGSPRDLSKKWNQSSFKNRQARIAALNQRQAQISIPALAAGAVQQTQAAQAAQQPVQTSQPATPGQATGAAQPARTSSASQGSSGAVVRFGGQDIPYREYLRLMENLTSTFDSAYYDPQRMPKPTKSQMDQRFALMTALGEQGNVGLTGILDRLTGGITFTKGNKQAGFSSTDSPYVQSEIARLKAEGWKQQKQPKMDLNAMLEAIRLNALQSEGLAPIEKVKLSKGPVFRKDFSRKKRAAQKAGKKVSDKKIQKK